MTSMVDFCPYIFLYVALTAVLIFSVLNIRRFQTLFTRNSKLPPGPIGIPILGNLPQMVKDPHLKLSQWAKQYGKMCTIYLGSKPTLLLSDSTWIKEMFENHAATGKFKSDTLMLISQGPYGVLNTEGSQWAEQRQFCVKSMNEFGLRSGKSMEPLILHEAQALCEWIKEETEKTSGKSVFINKVLQQATLNTLWTLVSGERVKLGESEIYRLLHQFEITLQYSMKTGLGFFPQLKHLSSRLSGYDALDKACKDLHQFVEKKFVEHQKTYGEGEKRDLIDFHIEHLENARRARNDKGDSFQEREDLMNAVVSIVELFLAGGETTAITVNWALFYLSYYQEAQKKLQAEIDEVIGRERDPSLSDKTRMPFTEAVILETLRLSSIVPYGVIHLLLEDVSFHGYDLPAGLLLIANMFHVHHDPKIWGDPEVFRPERFLSDNGASLKKHLVPFQTGKIQCLGEPLARNIVFLFISKIFQHCHFTLDPNFCGEDYLKPDVGLLLIPKPLGLSMTTR